MRTFLSALFLCIPALVNAQSADDTRGVTTVSTSASHSVRVQADRATLYFLVEGTAETSELALQRLAEKVRAVRDAIVKSGAAAEPPASFPYGLAPTPNNSGVSWPANIVPTTARAAIRVQITKLDQIPSMISVALAVGATSSSVPQFEFSGADTLRHSLLPVALQKAQRDAEALAAGMNGTIGEAVQVSTYGSGGSYAQPYISFTNRYDANGPAAIPELNIAASVSVAYRVVKKP